MTANLTLCPIADLPRDIDGHAWRLELRLDEDGGRTASWAGDVVPYCDPAAPGADSCRCLCDSDFVFGEPCPVDP